MTLERAISGEIGNWQVESKGELKRYQLEEVEKASNNIARFLITKMNTNLFFHFKDVQKRNFFNFHIPTLEINIINILGWFHPDIFLCIC